MNREVIILISYPIQILPELTKKNEMSFSNVDKLSAVGKNIFLVYYILIFKQIFCFWFKINVIRFQKSIYFNNADKKANIFCLKRYQVTVIFQNIYIVFFFLVLKVQNCMNS